MIRHKLTYSEGWIKPRFQVACTCGWWQRMNHNTNIHALGRAHLRSVTEGLIK